ncbi:hypothetical protein BVX99_01425 [bacterium F16]|nr:hypothetical protein BVX99_01425 [bacterium F16]
MTKKGPEKSNKLLWSLIAIWLVFAVISFFVTKKYAVIVFSKAPQTNSWPSVKGVPSWEHHRSRSNSDQPGTENFTYTNCDYTYNVGGTTYTGDVFHWGETCPPGSGFFLTHPERDEVKAKFEDKDGKVTVYYNPSDPSQAVLLRGINTEHIVYMLLWPFFTLIYTGFAWFLLYLFSLPPNEVEFVFPCPRCETEIECYKGMAQKMNWCPECEVRFQFPVNPYLEDPKSEIRSQKDPDQLHQEELTMECPHCSQDLNVSKDLLGQVVECPSCRQQLALPEE